MTPTGKFENARVEGTLPRKAWGGLLIRRECWTISLAGKLLLFLAVAAFGITLMRGLYPFLAVTKPLSGKILVVEGWMPSYMVKQIAVQFKAGKFEKILVVKPLHKGLKPYESGEFHARYVADNLVEFGIPNDQVEIVFFEPSNKDRTYQSALAANKWLEEHGYGTSVVNVATLGPHARRSRLLFEMALKGKEVGVIALNERMYDPEHWWRSSEGVREVLFELVAYLYVKFFFFPSQHGGFLLNELKAKGNLRGEDFDTSFFPELIRHHCQSEGIRFIDVEPLPQSMYNKGEKLNFDLDAHFNAPTSRVIGGLLCGGRSRLSADTLQQVGRRPTND